MTIYPWHLTISIDEYPFDFTRDESGRGGVLISSDVDMDDSNYVDALARAVKIYPHVSNFATLLECRNAWYTRRIYGDDFEGYYDRADILHIAHSFLNQDELTKPEWVAQFAQDLGTNTRPPRPEEPPKTKKKAEKPGYVYLLKSDKGHYKIGRTVNPESRSKTFGIQLPFDVAFECLIKTENMFGLEVELHARFADKRTTGEWFDLSPEDVEYIKGLVS